MIRPIQAVVDWYNRESFVRYAIRSGFRDETVRGDIRMVDGQTQDSICPGQLRKLDERGRIFYCMFAADDKEVQVTALGVDGLRKYRWEKPKTRQGAVLE